VKGYELNGCARFLARARAFSGALTLFLVSSCRDPANVVPSRDPTSKAEAVAPLPSAAEAATKPEPRASAKPVTDTPRLPPLRGVEWLEQLDLGGGDAAAVTPPLGATEPRPLVVAVHGAHDRPEWACGGWRLGFAVHPFIVCPRGSPVGGGKFAWSSAAAIERATLAAIARVKERFGAHVAPPPYVFAGFSQGATLAEPILVRNAALFPTVILAEGGYATLESARFARSFRENGGRTLVIVCGTGGCRSRTRAALPTLQRAGLRVFESGDVRSGHNLNQPMQSALRRDLVSWFADDPAWQGLMRREPDAP
jgi:predicted esterase